MSKKKPFRKSSLIRSIMPKAMHYSILICLINVHIAGDTGEYKQTVYGSRLSLHPV